MRFVGLDIGEPSIYEEEGTRSSNKSDASVCRIVVFDPKVSGMLELRNLVEKLREEAGVPAACQGEESAGEDRKQDP